MKTESNRKSGSNTTVETTGEHKKLKSFLGAIQYLATNETFGTDRPTEKTIEKIEPWIWGKEQQKDFKKTNVDRKTMSSTLCKR